MQNTGSKDNTELRPLRIDSNYVVSDDGNLWRILKGRPRHRNTRRHEYKNTSFGWLRKVYGTPGGKYRNYIRVTMNDKGMSLHRLVLSTFLPREDEDLLQVNHKDRNTFNNSLENLEWCNNRENVQHRLATVREKSYSDLKKEKEEHDKETAKLSDIYVPKVMGEWQIKYDIDAIKYELETNPASLEVISKKLKCSHRAMRYWQEKLKVKRPKHRHDIQKVLSLHESGVPFREIAKIIGCVPTTVHSLIRKGTAQRLSKAEHCSSE